MSTTDGKVTTTGEGSEEEINVDQRYQQLAQEVSGPKGVQVKDRTYFFRTYENCFVGTELVDWLIKNNYAGDREVAVEMGNVLYRNGLFQHVTNDHELKDEALYYRFRHHDPEFVEKLNGTENEAQGMEKEALAALLPPLSSKEADAFLHTLTRGFPASERVVNTDPSELNLSPMDEHNQELIKHVHPEEWINPTPAENYNVVVIGAGAGGLVTAAGSAGVGARVAIIEEHLYGGDCLNVGCVPSKALLRCARTCWEVKNSASFGVEVQGEVKVDFGAIMERMRAIRAKIAPNDSVHRFTELGIDVFIGHAQFENRNCVSVNGQQLNFTKAVIATGARAAVPPIKGIDGVRFLTNATLFNLEELPRRFGVIGTGAIGCEMAQAFARFGSETYLFGRSEGILKTEEADAAAVVQGQMASDGVEMVLGIAYEEVRENEAGEIEVDVRNETTGEVQTYVVDELLVATGRKPNVEGMNLEEIGVEYDAKKGLTVSDSLQTTVSNIYGVGDVCSKFKFTHVSDWHARLVIRNALFYGRAKESSLVVPWCTYTSPELAHVGSYPQELEEAGVEYSTYEVMLADNDRAICDGEEQGFVRVHVNSSGAILGGTIVAENAGDMISEVTTCMVNGVSMASQATVIHPYPTQMDALRRCGDFYNRTKLTPFVAGLFDKLMSLNR